MKTFNNEEASRSLRLSLERAWHSGGALWWCLLAGLAFASAAATCAMHLWRRGVADIANTQLQSAHGLLQRPALASQVASVPVQADFVQALPESVDTQALLDTLNRSSVDAGVVLSSVQLQPRAGTQELLAHTDLVVLARGSYPKLKQVIGEAIGRYPHASLFQLSMRRGGPPEVIEATMAIRAWGAPALSASAPLVPGAQ